MFIKTLFLILCSLIFFNNAFSATRIVGKFGKTYTISEKDAYKEILEKVKEKGIDNYYLSLKSKILQHTVATHNLGRATEDKTYKLNITFQLPFDIKDHTGKVIYPRGYTFNPLKHVNLPFTLVFFDATSGKELKWLKESGMLEKPNIVLILTRGSTIDASNMLNRIVYLGDERVLKYFSITKTPSIVYQEGDKLILKEVGIYKDGALPAGSSNKKKKNISNNKR